ncbi:hypothetical protein ABBQ38_014518 [Trebouxia sp. C0009 RCD-2024]
MLAGSLVVALLLLTLNPASGRLRATQTYTVSRTPLDKPQIETHKGFAIGQDSDYRSEATVQAKQPAAGTADRWVLVFKQDTAIRAMQALCTEAQAAARGRFSGSCTRLHTGTLMRGLSGIFTATDIQQISRLYQDSLLAVEKDGTFQVDQEPSPSSSSSVLKEAERQQAAASSAPATGSTGFPTTPWGLDMIDQRTLPLDHLYHYSGLGSGVHVYMVDTGIRLTHEDFGHMDGTPGSRAVAGFSVFGDNNSSDCYGHGTHTAATVGGLTYGVAKNATLVAVRALDCFGQASYTNVITALQWVADNAQHPAIVSTSVAGKYSAAVNQAVQSLIDDHGITVVAAAGNDNEDACQRLPAGAPGAIAVGAVDSQMRRWFSSNWGSCAALHAPGVDIISAGLASDTASAVKTGTSMAVPHASGVAALYLEANPGASPADVKEQLVASATYDMIQDDPAGGASLEGIGSGMLDISPTPNRLLYSMLNKQRPSET